MNNLSTREAYGQALAELGDLRDDIVVLDADLSLVKRIQILLF